jgi:hypothetical protein
MHQDTIDPRMRHTIYHQIGFRLLDFEYTAPPLSPTYGKLKDLLLTVYLTPHIPKMPLEESKYYLPSSVLNNFIHVCITSLDFSSFFLVLCNFSQCIKVLWKNAQAMGRISGKPEDDADFRRSLDQIDLREKIPLLDLPWGAAKPWTLVDLWGMSCLFVLFLFVSNNCCYGFELTQLQRILMMNCFTGFTMS